MILVVEFPVCFAAVREEAHVSLFREQLHEAEHIAVHLPLKALVDHPAAFLFGDGRGREQAKVFRLRLKRLPKHGKLLKDGAVQSLVPGQVIQCARVYACDSGHALSPNSSMK